MRIIKALIRVINSWVDLQVKKCWRSAMGGCKHWEKD